VSNRRQALSQPVVRLGGAAVHARLDEQVSNFLGRHPLILVASAFRRKIDIRDALAGSLRNFRLKAEATSLVFGGPTSA